MEVYPKTLAELRRWLTAREAETRGTQDIVPTGAKGISLLDKSNERANAAEVGGSARGYLLLLVRLTKHPTF